MYLYSKYRVDGSIYPDRVSVYDEYALDASDAKRKH